MAKSLNTRAHSAKICWQVIDQGRSLDGALADYVSQYRPNPKDKGFVQEVVYGVCRWYGELDSVASKYLKTPIRKKDRVIHFLLLVGFYQLRHLQTAKHAAVAETVGACKQLNKIWAKKLVNGCLRNYQRNPAEVADATSASHPKWLREEISKAWPNHALAIQHANNQRPPMCIRVNRGFNTRDDYLNQLKNVGIAANSDPYSQDGIILDKAVNVSLLPGFDLGWCSVQDTAAQLAADILDIRHGHHILDACAAPGGKTAHILERLDNTGLLHAVDISEARCQQLDETLRRLNLKAERFVGDASSEVSWPAPEDGYDRILVDSPCSGLGVIRRHPDIKHHRRPSDIAALNRSQAALLENLWGLLKPQGKLLYMTCSILPSENENQIEQFIAKKNNLIICDVKHPNALELKHGLQTLPGVHNMDGFYYCLLQKC